jgi:two-component system, chemotaxis family, chemotaxis protein CheY
MMHILFIDDDLDFMDVVSADLRRAGYRVTCVLGCTAGLDAVSAALAEEAVDAVLVDIFMPETDGLETIRALRESGVTAPVIAISGGGAARFDGALAWATALGANASLAKPFEMTRLLEVLRSVSALHSVDDTEAHGSIGVR